MFYMTGVQQPRRQFVDAVLDHGADEAQVGFVVLVGGPELEVDPRGVEGGPLAELHRASDAVHVQEGSGK